jgi:hypothetical protein
MPFEKKPPGGQIPPEIRRACLILGLPPEELTSDSVIQAWKTQIAAPGVHPDDGGDTKAAIYLNTAKDTIIRWLKGDGDPHQPSGVPRRPSA